MKYHYDESRALLKVYHGKSNYVYKDFPYCHYRTFQQYYKLGLWGRLWQLINPYLSKETKDEQIRD